MHRSSYVLDESRRAKTLWPVATERTDDSAPRARRLRGIHPRTSTRHTGSMATVTEVKPDDIVDLDRPWVVIVWNDPINLMAYVTWVFQKLFGYSLEKATALMLDVHEKGRAVVSSGTRERAEVDVQRLHEHGLWATMQRDDA